jgi:heme exporter protein D
MIWNSWSDFFAMGGYALYVWGSILVVAGFIAGELFELTWRRKAILAELSLAKKLRKKTAGADA